MVEQGGVFLLKLFLEAAVKTSGGEVSCGSLAAAPYYMTARGDLNSRSKVREEALSSLMVCVCLHSLRFFKTGGEALLLVGKQNGASEPSLLLRRTVLSEDTARMSGAHAAISCGHAPDRAGVLLPIHSYVGRSPGGSMDWFYEIYELHHVLSP